jgi:hypothetical protein
MRAKINAKNYFPKRGSFYYTPSFKRTVVACEVCFMPKFVLILFLVPGSPLIFYYIIYFQLFYFNFYLFDNALLLWRRDPLLGNDLETNNETRAVAMQQRGKHAFRTIYL